MEMIVGGAWQGKTDYARRQHPEVSFLEGAEVRTELLWQAEGILNFQDYIRKALQAGKDLSDLPRILLEKNPDLILTVQEVGSGLVPMDPFERRYRESVGRICTALAAGSSKVVRIVAGLPVLLKDPEGAMRA